MSRDRNDRRTFRRRIALACLAAALALPAATALADTPQQEANKKVVLEFYAAGLNQQALAKASQYFGARYTQHNPNAAVGEEGFRKFVDFLREKFPNSHSEIKKVFVDGDYVILHVHAVREPAPAVTPSWTSSSSRTAKSWSIGT